MPADFVTEHLGRCHADMLWRLRISDGQHLLVHFEFQSTVDRGMAFRTMNYAGGIWAGLRSDRPAPDLIGPGGTLPLILSVVVYGGRRLWTAPRELREILASAPEELLGSRPQHRYLPIDLQRVDPASLTKDSVLAMIAELERARAPEQVAKVARSVIDWAKRGAEPELRDRLGEWISQVLVTLHGSEGREDFAPVLAGISDSDRLTAIATGVFACESAAELVRWARGGESAG